MDEQAIEKQRNVRPTPLARALWDQLWREHILGPIIERAGQQAKQPADEDKEQTD